jgi:hypothetical protein
MGETKTKTSKPQTQNMNAIIDKVIKVPPPKNEKSNNLTH